MESFLVGLSLFYLILKPFPIVFQTLANEWRIPLNTEALWQDIDEALHGTIHHNAAHLLTVKL